METVFEKLRNHGTNVYRHARKHHRKYLLGVAGFFGLFKIFSFLAVSISGYMLTSAYLQPEGMKPFTLGTQDFQFFLGDQNCSQIQETRESPPKVYICVTGSNVENIQTMRFSVLSEDDIAAHDRFPFANASVIELPAESEGQKYIYAQFGYDTGTYATVKAAIDIARVNMGPLAIASRTIPMGESMDMTDRYLIIRAPESLSQIIIDTAGRTGTLTVAGGDRYGIINPPTAITDKREATKGEVGLPDDFSSVQAFAVGANGVRLIADDATRFDIAFQITEPKTSIGDTLDVYHSDDGSSWESLGATCVVDAQRICNISTTRLGLFGLGRAGILNALTTGTIVNPISTGGFRESDPTPQEIIASFFGTGKRDGAYTTHLSKRYCNSEDMNVVRLQPGSGTIPRYPYSNTIYLLESGTYISPYMTDVMGTCIVIMGIDTGVELYTTAKKGANIKVSYGQHVIIENINLHGEDDGTGGTHDANNYGIFIGTSGNTLYKINAYAYGGYGVYLDDFDNMMGEIKSFKTATMQLVAQHDTYIDVNDQQKNFGRSDQLLADEWGSKALIRFNLSSIPASAKISQATLSLTKIGGSAQTMNINRILNNSRVEGVSDGLFSIPGEPDYLHSAFPDTVRYGGEGMVAGRDYDAKDIIDDKDVGKISTPKPFAFNTYGRATIQERIRYPELNQGVVISTENASLKIASKDQAQDTYSPSLSLTYQYEESNSWNAPVLLPLSDDEETIKDVMIQQGYIKTGNTMRGVNPLDLSMSQGKLTLPIIMESTDDGTTVTFTKGTSIKTKDEIAYGGYLIGPKSVSLGTLSGKLPDQDIIKAFKIGSPNEQLVIEDEIGNAKLVDIMVPLNGEKAGTRIMIHYTSDGEHFDQMRSAVVQELDGRPYIRFSTYHFTTFILSKNTSDCSLVINNDADRTEYAAAMLQISCKDAIRMRFSNLSYADLSGQDRKDIQPNYPRTLAGTEGANTVYAEFDDGTGKITTDDSIFYSPKGPVQGNGMIERGEQCDDSNIDSGDGCSSTGMLESGFICAGEPTICEKTVQAEIVPSTGMEVTPSVGAEMAPATGIETITPVPETLLPSTGGEMIQIAPEAPVNEMIFSGVVTISPSPIGRGKKILLDTPIKVNSKSRILGSLIISGVGSMEISGADRNGKVSAPQMLDHTDTHYATKRKRGLSPKDKILQTIKVGNATTDLVPDQGSYEVSFEVLDGKPGMKNSLLYSPDGEIWTSDSMEISCTLDADFMCAFETDKLGYFAVVQKGIDTPTMITDAFREANPESGAIISMLFGDTMTPSLYMSNRTSGGACDPAKINVEYLTPNIFDLTTTKANTIYVLASGAYTITKPITISGACSALIGQGKVNLSSDKALEHFIEIKSSEVILDNLSINGNANDKQSIFGILADNQRDITFNALELFNFYDAIKLSDTKNILLSYAKLFNVNRGINFERTQDAIVDSVMASNDSEGLIVQGSERIAINNSQFFNDDAGIELNASTGIIINNSAIYSSKTGLLMSQSTDMTLNDVSIFNNSQIAQVTGSSNATYQGTLRMFSNSGQDLFASYGIQAGKKSKKSGYDFSKGTLDATVMTGGFCKRSSNVRYTIAGVKGAISLQKDEPLNGCDIRGKKGIGSIEEVIGYTYGDKVLMQVPVIGYKGKEKIAASSEGYDIGLPMGKMEQEAPAKVMLPSQADSRSIEAQLKDSGRFKVKGDGKTLEGSSALDLSKSKGKLLVPMIQESDPSSRTEQIRVTYPAGTVVKSRGKAYTGTIKTPTYKKAGQVMKEASLLYPEMDIISLGDDNNPMSFEDENGNPTEVEVEVEIPRGRYYAGNKQKLLYSEDNGVTWKEFGTAPIIDLGNGKRGMKFTTNHFTNYAMGNSRIYTLVPLSERVTNGYYVYRQGYFYQQARTNQGTVYNCSSTEYLNGTTYVQGSTYDTKYPANSLPASNCTTAYRFVSAQDEYDGYWSTSSETFYIDVTNPTTSFSSPASGSTQTATFNVSTSDSDVGAGLSTCYYAIYDNGTLKLNGATRTCNSSFSVTVGASQNCNTNGTNTCRVDIYNTDVVGRTSSTVTRYFTINTDSTPPSTSVGSSAPAAGTYYNGYVYTYFTDTDNVGFGTCYSTVRQGSTTVEATGTRSCGTNIAVGTNNCTSNGTNACTFYGWSVDAAGNQSSTASISYSIDTIPPTSTWNSPAASACISGTATFSLTDSSTGAGLDVCYMRLNGNLLTRTCSTPPYTDTNIKLWCTSDGLNTCAGSGYDRDLAGNYSNNAGSPNRSFSVDTTAPTTPTLTNGTTYTTYTPTLPWGTATDAGAGNCAGTVRYEGIVYTDSSCTTQSQTIALTTSTSAAITSMANGTHSYKIRAVDIMGNYGSYSSCTTFIINVDSTPPAIGAIGISAAGGAVYGTYFKGSINMSASATDASNSVSCQYTTNNGTSRTAGSRSSNTCSVSAISPGVNITANFKGTDPSSNVGYGTTGTFTYDATAPAFSSTTSFLTSRYSGAQTATFYYTDAGVNGSRSNPTCNISSESATANCTNSAINVCDYLSNCNTTPQTSNSIKLDTVKPYILSKTTYTANRYSGAQTSTRQYADVTAGLFSVSGTGCTISTDGAAATCNITPTVIDNAGNSTGATQTSNSIKLDTVKPYILSKTTYTANRYSGAQTSTRQYADVTAGLFSVSGTGCTISMDGAAATCNITPTVIDNAGNSTGATQTSNSIKLDTVKPYLASSPSFAGWYTSAQTATWSYADVTAGINSTSSNTCQINEGNPGTCNTTPTVIDNAGNSTGGVLYSASAYVDLNNPTVGSATISAGTTYGSWYKGTISLQATATDTIGVTSCQYTTGSRAAAATATYSAGTCTISNITPTTTINANFRAYDASTRVGYGTTGTFNYDATPPYLSSYSGTSTTGRFSGNQMQTFNYTDAGAGGATLSTGCTISTEGNPTTCNIANPNICDYLSNCNTTSVTSSGIKLDKTKPTTSFTSGTTQTTTFSVTINDSDTLAGATGCMFRILSGTTQVSGWTARVCGASVSIPATTYCPASGTGCTVVAYSSDNAGNTSLYATGWFNMSYDLTVPTVGAARLNSGTIYGVYFKGNIGIAASGTDNIAVTSCEYTTGVTRAAASYTSPNCYVNSIAPGVSFTLNFRAYDAVNNIGTGTSTGLIYDATPSVTTISSPSSGSTMSGNFTVTFADSDAGAGLSGCYVRIMSGTAQTTGRINRTCNTTFTINKASYCAAEGLNVCTVVGYSMDYLGNIATYATGSYDIDTTVPTTTISSPSNGSTFSGNFTVTFADNDNQGLSACYIRIMSGTVQTSGRTARSCSSAVTINKASYCPTDGTNNCLVVGYAVDSGGLVGTYVTGSYTIDATKPSVTLTTGNLGAYFTGANFLMTGTFNEAVSGFTGGDISGTNATFSNVTAINPTTYQRTVTPTAQGAFTVTILTGVAVDIAGNPNNVSATISSTWDTTSPTVTTGYIYSGFAAYNGTTGYYDGTVDISGSVSDNLGLSGNTCQYTTGSSWVAATYSGNSTTGFCYTTGLNFTTTLKIRFSIKDNAGFMTTGATGTYVYDNTAPGTSTIVSPMSGQILSTGTIALQRSSGSDAGVGMSGYVFQISTGTTFAVIVKSGTVVMNTGATVTGLADATYYRRVYGYDDFVNTGSWSATGIFIVDTTGPTMTTGYIYSGYGGYNGITGYYSGPLAISGSVSDAIGISGNTCQYTTGLSRVAAAYSGTSTTGYCYATGLNFTSTLNIRFSVKDLAGRTTTGATGTYYLDSLRPTSPATVLPTSGQTLSTGTVRLQRSASTDTGIGISGYLYQVSTGTSFSLLTKSGITSSTGITLTGMADATYYRRVYAFDKFVNQSSRSNLPVFTVDTSGPTIINVTSTTNNGSYNSGKVIIQVKFSEPVTINTGSGIPMLFLNSQRF